MSNLKIKLLSAVPILPIQPIPPLGIAILTSYFRQKGYNVYQDDLSIKFKNFNEENPLRFINLLPLSNYQRVVSYLKGKEDDVLTKINHRLESLSNLKDYDIIGFSIHSHHEIATSLLLAKYIKEKYGPKIMFGGSAMSSPLLQDFVKQFTFIDYMIKGYEQDLEIILKNTEGKKTKIRHIKQPYNIKKTPQPDFNGLPLELYSKPLVLPYQPNKGCNMRCSFCSYNFYNGDYQEQSINKIIKELKILKDDYGVYHFNFVSENFAHNPIFVKKLCNQFLKKRLNIKWAAEIRPTLTMETFRLMNKAGCEGFTAPLESASQNILMFMKKPPVRHIEKVINYCNKTGMKCIVDVICGCPHETIKDVNSSVRFIKKFYNKASFKPDLFALEWGSPLFLEPEKYGITNLRFNQESILGMSDRLSYEFDEIGRLKWKDKHKQQLRALYLIKKACYPAIASHLGILNQFLPFSVYNFLSDSCIGDYSRWVSKRKQLYTPFYFL